MSQYSVIKPGLKTAIADAVYNEVLYNTNNYHYFVGRTRDWPSGQSDNLVNTQASEVDARTNMAFVKKVRPGDIALMIPRYNWTNGEVYDMYDDQLQIMYTVSGDTDGNQLDGTFDLTTFGPDWLATGPGIPSGTFVSTATDSLVTLSEVLTQNATVVTFSKVTPSGETALENCQFFVLAGNNNVYKCLDNNNASPSTVQPYSLSIDPFQTADGYVWKYMYTIPSSLYNRFISDTDIPIITSLKQPYYSNGAINNVVIVSGGSGYTSEDTISVFGDGSLVGNRYRITDITVVDAGNGYTAAPTITISYPHNLQSVVLEEFSLNTEYSVDTYVEYQHNVYRVSSVTDNSESGDFYPTHISTTPLPNGNIMLQYIGSQAAAEVTDLTEDTGIDPTTCKLTNGFVGYVTLLNSGSGYDPETPPNVVFTSDGGGTLPSATAVVDAEGFISRIEITYPGYNLDSPVDVIIDPPVTGTQATATTVKYYGYGYEEIPTVTVASPFTSDVVFTGTGDIVNTDDIVEYDGRFYTVDAPPEGDPDLPRVLGGLGEGPVHTIGSLSNGDASLTYIGQTAVVSLAVVKTEAVLLPIFNDSELVGVQIVDGGEGYHDASLIVNSSTGTGAVIEPDFYIGNLNTQQSNIETLAVRGTIDAIDILNGGTGYNAIGNVVCTITVDGDGSGCEARPVVENGVLTKVKIIHPGSGYTYATVTVNGEYTTQAYCRAIISPINGHGSNAVRELFASSFAISTSITFKEKNMNQGLTVTNEYRQSGLIKNITEYNSSRRFANSAGSACFLITGDFSAGADDDQIITDQGGKRYCVVASTDMSLLVQSLDGGVLAKDDIVNTAGTRTPIGDYSITLTSVTLPDVDKYSGEMMSLGNRDVFQSTDQQSILIKTIIRL